MLKAQLPERERLDNSLLKDSRRRVELIHYGQGRNGTLQESPNRWRSAEHENEETEVFTGDAGEMSPITKKGLPLPLETGNYSARFETSPKIDLKIKFP